MTINKAQVQKNFSQNAMTYDQYAVVQKEMARELLVKIKNTGKCFRNILEIGCGTGFLTELLAKEYPLAQITATDIAPDMIVVARKKLANFSNIHFSLADGENLTANNVSLEPSFDLIVSNAVFQWFIDCSAAFTKYHDYLEPGGYLIFTTLGAGTFRELYISLEEKKQPFIENKHLQKVMADAGFQTSGLEEVTKMEYFNSSRHFLRALKRIGANNHLTEELAVKGSNIFSLVKSYDAKFLGKRGVPATYQCLFGWGRKNNRPLTSK